MSITVGVRRYELNHGLKRDMRVHKVAGNWANLVRAEFLNTNEVAIGPIFLPSTSRSICFKSYTVREELPKYRAF